MHSLGATGVLAVDDVEGETMGNLGETWQLRWDQMGPNKTETDLESSDELQRVS